MSERQPAMSQVILTVGLAFILWAVVFGFKAINFWLGLGVSSACLALLALLFGGLPLRRQDITPTGLLAGLAGAVLLYGIFWLANWLAPLVLPFAGKEVADIYSIRREGDPLLIAMILIFVSSPAEEIFWRGFLQNFITARLGRHKGLLVTSVLYAAVHIVSGNLMLVGAALTAGLFWGSLYRITGNLLVCIVSHIVWAVSIFVLWPIN